MITFKIYWFQNYDQLSKFDSYRCCVRITYLSTFHPQFFVVIVFHSNGKRTDQVRFFFKKKYVESGVSRWYQLLSSMYADILKLRSDTTDIQDLTPNVLVFLVWVKRGHVIILYLNDEVKSSLHWVEEHCGHFRTWIRRKNQILMQVYEIMWRR